MLTDFGQVDTYVGVMHGVLWTYAKRLRAVVDLTHEVPAQEVTIASFHLDAAFRWFPPGTVHVAVVDPGVGSGRAILAARIGEHFFLAPDNGLLARLLDGAADREVVAVDVERVGLATCSATFHGRDVFSPAAALLVDGQAVSDLGRPVLDWSRAAAPSPERVSDKPESYRGEVVSVDRFGNLITNLPGSLLGDEHREWELEIAGQCLPVAGTYADVARGQALALVDSYGLLEAAVRNGDAARALGAGRGVPALLRRRT
ncbi:Adenosyl-chloride synthase [Planctomycetes bacterium Pla86]|uniref:Adenosyl-chloride synthase n=2 Tax=Engelhardtia mirabilis TaxID=2528011 RepID=A0A518BJX3_9BACT|nr:Adenosyl-chloride synthase [Planctomycetes bacterium Pla133]QDV01598.1 Adenosyl-chloride synthase [Planctomycetes bacterium Pla86]